MVYVFAGHRRRADVREQLEALAVKHGFELVMHEVDLVRGADQDVLNEKFWCELTDFIRQFKPFCIIATPPCSTYSRARHLYKRFPGPRPIRSRQHPDGFPWLTNQRAQQAAQGTAFAKKTWELSNLAAELDARFLSEFPEDLGKTDTGIPASLWQMQEFMDNLARRNMKTFALFQCEFGAETPKPTRFLSDLDFFEGNIYEGVREFDKDWRYKGPLPRGCPHSGQHDPLIGTDQDGNWKTAPAAHYPGRLCLFLAKAIYKTWSSASSAALGSWAPEASGPQGLTAASASGPPGLTAASGHQERSEDPVAAVSKGPQKHVDKELDPEVIIQSGCQGPPLQASFAGRTEEFCDGMGLCSPGRWHPKFRQLKRTPQQRDYCKALVDLIDRFCISKLGDLSKATMKLALGRFQTSPFSADDLAELRASWFKLLPDPRRAAEVPSDQPFLLHALAQSLRQMGDPDVDIIDNEPYSCFTDGVHLGHVRPLGPTPQVYRRRNKEASYDESE